MVRRHPGFDIYIREQFTRPLIRTAHQVLPTKPRHDSNHIRGLMSASLVVFQRPARAFAFWSFGTPTANGFSENIIRGRVTCPGYSLAAMRPPAVAFNAA